jgi:hypothetical protein
MFIISRSIYSLSTVFAIKHDLVDKGNPFGFESYKITESRYCDGKHTFQLFSFQNKWDNIPNCMVFNTLTFKFQTYVVQNLKIIYQCVEHVYSYIYDLDIDFWCYNDTFSNISAISWRSVLVVEEVGVPGENLRPWTSNW